MLSKYIGLVEKLLSKHVALIGWMARAVLLASTIILLLNFVLYMVTHLYIMLGNPATTLLIIMAVSGMIVWVCAHGEREWNSWQDD